MALVNCKACGKEIGKGVSKCVHCGTDQRNFFGKHKIVTAVLVLIVLGGIGHAMGNDDKSKTAFAPVATSSAPAPVPTPVEKKWTTVKSWSGNGAKDTESFAVTENTRINWETTGAQGVFQIYVQDGQGLPAAVAANAQGVGKDVSYLHIAPGQYSLKINCALTPWKVSVEEQQ